MFAKYYYKGHYKFTCHYIVKIKPNNKHGYFETTQKINRYEILTIQRYTEVDKVEIYRDFEKKPIEVIEARKGD